MAAKSFLTSQEWKQAKSLLSEKKFSDFPQGHQIKLADWLSETLLNKFESIKGWRESRPIAIGSWGRNELTPLSDIDILFAGSDSAAKVVMDAIREMGLLVLARQPLDKKDWTKGADEFDMLSYLTGNSLYQEDAELLLQQKQKVLSHQRTIDKIRDKLLENKQLRNKRYDSIANYLEPHLKNGPGGYRDLYQAEMIAELYFRNDKRFAQFVEQIKKYKEFFLNLRQLCHLLGRRDILTSGIQQDIKDFLGYKSITELMYPIQLALYQGNFLHDFFAQASLMKACEVDSAFKIKSASTTQIGESLLKDPSAVNVKVAETLCLNGGFQLDQKDYGCLTRTITPELSEQQLRALFRSGWLQIFIPELTPLRGLVQHDQYHRYTVEAHLFVAMREVLRVINDGSKLKDILDVTKGFTKKDWTIIFITALFHDLAKGSGKDHSIAGENLAKKYLTLWGYNEEFVNDVSWLVRHHLSLSNAAFRRNPSSVNTWKILIREGVSGRRARLLSVFTVIDIVATNPDAWNDWKSKLLFDLYKKIEQFDNGYDVLDESLIDGLDLLEGLDTGVLESIPLSVIVNDLNKLKTADVAEPLLLKTEEGFWVRFFEKEDKQGILLRLTQTLYQLGCSIQQSYVHTLKGIGVYDWFLVKEPRNIERFQKQLKIIEQVKVKPPVVLFDKVLIVEENDNETLFSFRGADQAGALICALQSIFDEGLTIQWARVHTWGQQIDDTICVQKPKNSKKVLDNLTKKLCYPNKN